VRVKVTAGAGFRFWFGLAHLKGLDNLKELKLDDTHVTDASAKDLQEALPQVKIGYGPSTKQTEP